jgi:hypothetical protein
MGIDLRPDRRLAMARVGWRHISCTGPTFSLTNGEEVVMPSRIEIAKTLNPLIFSDGNDYYAYYVAHHLGDKISAEVDAYRLPAKEYSTDIAAAWQVVEKLRPMRIRTAGTCVIDVTSHALGHTVAITETEYEFTLGAATADTAPHAICLAALEALASTEDQR